MTPGGKANRDQAELGIAVRAGKRVIGGEKVGLRVRLGSLARVDLRVEPTARGTGHERLGVGLGPGSWLHPGPSFAAGQRQKHDVRLAS